MQTLRVIGFLSLVLATAVAAQQQSAAPVPGAVPVPDLEGGWVRIDVDGSGSFNGLAAKFPRAVLTPRLRRRWLNKPNAPRNRDSISAVTRPSRDLQGKATW